MALTIPPTIGISSATALTRLTTAALRMLLLGASTPRDYASVRRSPENDAQVALLARSLTGRAGRTTFRCRRLRAHWWACRPTIFSSALVISARTMPKPTITAGCTAAFTRGKRSRQPWVNPPRSIRTSSSPCGRSTRTDGAPGRDPDRADHDQKHPGHATTALRKKRSLPRASLLPGSTSCSTGRSTRERRLSTTRCSLTGYAASATRNGRFERAGSRHEDAAAGSQKALAAKGHPTMKTMGKRWVRTIGCAVPPVFCSRSGARTRDLTIMSRALSPTELPCRVGIRGHEDGCCEPRVRIELTTPSLPWKCSTTELSGRAARGQLHENTRALSSANAARRWPAATRSGRSRRRRG